MTNNSPFALDLCKTCANVDSPKEKNFVLRKYQIQYEFTYHAMDMKSSSPVEEYDCCGIIFFGSKQQQQITLWELGRFWGFLYGFFPNMLSSNGLLKTGGS